MRYAFLYHFYSGHLFFSAASLFAISLVLDLSGWLDARPNARRIAGFAAVMAIALAGLSGTPMPLIIAVPVLVFTTMYAMIGFGARRLRRLSLGMPAFAAVVATITLEVPYHAAHRNVPRPAKLYVIGDSLASGGFGERTRWPEILGRDLGIRVANLAVPSDDAEMALHEQVPRLPRRAARNECVLIEIGGNDMLAGAPAKRFAGSLESIIAVARDRGDRRVIMLELPLLPGAWRYGAAQRRLTAKYGVILIPKRILARVLLDRDNTSDGLHLTQRGHNALAREIARWLGWSS